MIKDTSKCYYNPPDPSYDLPFSERKARKGGGGAGIKSEDKKRSYEEWLKDFSKENKNYKKGFDYIISKFYDDFPGEIAIVGSSVNERYPLGRDLDILLIGMGKEAAKFSDKIFRKFKKEYQWNLACIKKNKKLCFPAILGVSRGENPFIEAIKGEEIISGHKGTNFQLEVLLRKEINYSPLIIDIITDISYMDRGIRENFNHWESVMKKEEENYVLYKNQ